MMEDLIIKDQEPIQIENKEEYFPTKPNFKLLKSSVKELLAQLLKF